MGDTEQTLLTADAPIPWAWEAFTPLCGRWHASLDWVQYYITNDYTIDISVDALNSPCPWRLTIHCIEKSNSGVAHAASLEEARRFALHHFLTRDLTEIVTVHAGEVAAYEAARKTYETQWQSARVNIVERFLAHKTPYLTADTPDRTVAEFRMSGRRGTYHARFDPQRRWIVTYTRPDTTTEERCFLARTFVEMGCSYHSQMGEWRGTLRTNQKPLAQYLAPPQVTPRPAKIKEPIGEREGTEP